MPRALPKAQDEPAAPPARLETAALVGYAGLGVAALAFGASAGSRMYMNSSARELLLEKFKKQPSAAEEAMARGGAFAAFAAGTLAAGALGVGAVALARSMGLKSASDLGEEISRRLPTAQSLEDIVTPKLLQPLKRRISQPLQEIRDSASRQFHRSEVGQGIASAAQPQEQAALQQWEKDLLQSVSQEAADAAMKDEPRAGSSGAK